MKMQEIREIAKTAGVSPGRYNKVDLVRNIQIVEGNFACFATAYDKTCDQSNCLWRKECFSQSKKLMDS